ncbi:hypothetical protein [Halobacteriovorax sp. DA5]|uniref:hypothetical protein n=1 Tax=Halobacteriovorax sp. DA5 TaxID=2067553 RepID=UPI000CD11D85|nr:hypothetical protein [Halobacteriovorax sp. DA5]POB13862.1 hypothetical protein C0Z22_07320 [Halobacteriovorax sp. DA5]
MENLKIKECITDIDLQQIIKLRETKKILQDQLKDMTDNLHHLEESVISKLKDGCINLTTKQLTIKESQRRFPSWKEHFIEKCGKQMATVIIENTEPKRYETLTIK